MSDTEITVAPGHQHNFKRGPAGAGGTYIRDTPTDLKPGETVILRSGAVEPPPPPPPPPPDPDPEPDPDPPPTDHIPQWVLDAVKPAPGWQVTGRDVFDTDIPQGEWGKPGGAFEFPGMTDGDWHWRATAYANTGTDSSKRGHYSGKDVAWVENGELLEYIRYGKKGVKPFRHDQAGVPLVNRPLLIGPEKNPATLADPYKDQTRRFSWDISLYAQYPGGWIATFKCAHLLWDHATIGTPGYAEYNMPEFKFGDGPRGNAFAHNEGTVGGQDSARLNTDTTDFHLFRMRFQAEGYKGHPTGFVEMFLDGKSVLRKTTNITPRDMYYAKQTECYLKRDKIAGEAGGPPLGAGGPQGIVRTRLFQIAELA